MNLAEWLTQKGLTDTDFAAIINVAPSTVGRIRRGLHRPDWPTMDAIRKATDGKVTPLDYELVPSERASA